MGQRIDAILVPQGAEYQAVCRGAGQVFAPMVFPVPIGSAPLRQSVNGLRESRQLFAGQQLLVMGLCGGLSAHHTIADAVVYQECIDRATGAVLPCDATLTDWLQTKLAKATLVRALTSDRLVSSAQAKQQLGQKYAADVVDMEGFAALDSLRQLGATVAMLRVISDDAQHDVPDLANAIDANGTLQTRPLAWGMIRQPIAAMRLIRGSLQGLKALQALTKQIL